MVNLLSLILVLVVNVSKTTCSLQMLAVLVLSVPSKDPLGGLGTPLRLLT